MDDLNVLHKRATSQNSPTIPTKRLSKATKQVQVGMTLEEIHERLEVHINNLQSLLVE